MIGIILAVVGMTMGFMFAIEPFNRNLNYWANSLLPNRIPTETELIEMRFRGIINKEEYIKLMKQLGYDEKRAEQVFEIRKSMLTAEKTIYAYWQGFISEEEFKQRMKKLGYDDKDIELFEKTARFYPSASDFIRFAVRDVYNERIVEKYGYDEEFPENIVEDIKKIGMDEKWIKAYWRAHWELPSPTQGYEMLHRLNPEVLKIRGEAYREMGLNPKDLETDLDSLRELLKIADYPKYWRDRLIAIAYSPLTRVDLRRVYELGLINREELIARLMEIGYTKKDAELLAKFFDLEKNKDLLDSVKSKLDDLYMIGKLTKEEYKNLLQSIGYSDIEIELTLEYLDYTIAERKRKEEMNAIEKLYKKGAISVNEAKKKLSALGIESNKINELIELWSKERAGQRKLLSKSDIEKLFKTKIIDEQKAREYLKKLNYSDEDIELLIKLWSGS